MFQLTGVDACNTALGVLIFCAAMNFGQSWATVVTLWGCTLNSLRGGNFQEINVTQQP